VIIRNDERSGKATEPTERKGRPDDPNRSGSSEDPEPTARLEPGKRMEIREVHGRLEVVECD
jgi:hypothetical protein